MTARVTKAEIERAIAAFTACGLAVGSVQIAPDGTIKIEAPVANNPESPQRSKPQAW